jgi:short-subunit dehydrogenase
MSRPLAVITGASSGLGVVFARKLAGDHDLLLIARRKDRLEAVAAELTAQFGCAAEILAADLTDESGLAAVAQRIAAEPRLELLVNNAGFGARGLFWESDYAVQQQMHQLHVMAILRLSHAALRNMVEKNEGGIINVASVAGFLQREGAVSYGATKRWVISFTEGIHLELKGMGSAVKVQALCPGFTFTEFHATLGVERQSVAPPSLWLQPEFVVNESLKALQQGKLIVVPGWKYKAIVSLVSKLPTPLRLAFEAAGSTKNSRWK